MQKPRVLGIDPILGIPVATVRPTPIPGMIVSLLTVALPHGKATLRSCLRFLRYVALGSGFAFLRGPLCLP